MTSSEDFSNFVNQLYFYTRKMAFELTCPCCSNMLKSPTVLPCNHMFCSKCIISKDNHCVCPTCRSICLHKDLRHSTHMGAMTSVYKSMSANVASLYQKLHSQTDSSVSGPGRADEGLPSHHSVASGRNVQPVQQDSSTVPSNGSIKKNSEEVAKKVAAEATEVKTKAGVVLNSPEPMTDAFPRRTGSFTRSKKREMERVFYCERNKQWLPAQDSSSSLQINSSSLKHSIVKEDCIILGYDCLNEMQGPQVTAPRGEMSLKESHVELQNNGETPKGSSNAGGELNGRQSGNPDVEETIVMRSCSTKRNSKEPLKDTKASAVSGPQKNSIDVATVKVESEDTNSLDPDNGNVQHSGPTTYDPNIAGPSSPPSAVLKRKLHELLDAVDNKTCETRSPSLPPEIKHCILEEKCSYILCQSGLPKSDEELLVRFADWTGALFNKSWRKNTTHLIVSTDSNGACTVTVKVLKAILNGRWILRMDWVKDCMNKGRLVQEERYEVHRVNVGDHICHNGPMRGRYSALIKAPKILLGIRFYFLDQFSPLERCTWEDLVMLAGATVLRKNELTLSHGNSTSYVVFNEACDENWTEDERAEVVHKRTNEAVDFKIKTGFALIGHKSIMETIAEFDFADRLARCAV